MPKAEKSSSDLPYRPCVGIMLVNMDGKVLVGQRIDSRTEAWQMPQGGVDEGQETQASALRELEEETGIVPKHVQIIAHSREELLYDLPKDLASTLWGGRYRGQRQLWYLARFMGKDSDIDIATKHPEFNEWRWADPEALPDLIVPFKRKLYRDVLKEFRDKI